MKLKVKYDKMMILLIIIILLLGNSSATLLNKTIEIRWLLLPILIMCLLLMLTKEKTKNNYRKKRITNQFVLLNFLFFGWLSITFFYSINSGKTLLGMLDLFMMTILILAFHYVIVNKQDENYLYYLAKISILIGAIFMLPLAYSILQGNLRGQSIAGPNVSTRILFFAFCGAWFYWRLKKRIVYLFFSITFIAGIVLLGSRGGLVGAIVSISFLLIVYYLFEKIKKNKNVKFKSSQVIFSILSLPALIGFISLIYGPIELVIRERIIGATFLGDDLYSSGRDVLYLYTIDLIKERPILGYGLNTFSNFFTEFGYPHNILLELLYSAGIIGGLYFIVLLYFAIKVIFNYRKSKYYVLSSIPLYMIIVQFFSGGLYDFRYYFFWLIILLHYNDFKKIKLRKFKI